MSPLYWNLLNLFGCVPLAMTLLNLLTWTRGRLEYEGTCRLSVLIPARDEADNIEACIAAVERGDVAPDEVIVYDDQSSDQTPEILSRLSLDHPKLKVIRGAELPEGWVGKPHACHHLAEAARGDVLLFVDADTVLEPSGIRRMLSLLSPTEGRRADLVTAVPRQLMESALERLLIPLLLLTYTSWFPLWLVANSRDHRFLAANGQLLMIRRSLYREIGGFERVAHEIVDDMALCRLAKKRHARVVFMDGYETARCRMYRSADALWTGFSKNIYEGIGGNPFALLFVIGLYSSAFIWPYVSSALSWALNLYSILYTALLGVAANMLMRLLLSLRYRHPISGVLLHPVSVIGLLALSINSFRCTLKDAIRWRGRAYCARRGRLAS
ncbi:MAG: glycosyltransferase [Deltaproteobacteria bacterium]|nr:glycosyltransferase [Deltaproteobacteria bacterium]